MPAKGKRPSNEFERLVIKPLRGYNLPSLTIDIGPVGCYSRLASNEG